MEESAEILSETLGYDDEKSTPNRSLSSARIKKGRKTSIEGQFLKKKRVRLRTVASINREERRVIAEARDRCRGSMTTRDMLHFSQAFKNLREGVAIQEQMEKLQQQINDMQDQHLSRIALLESELARR